MLHLHNLHPHQHQPNLRKRSASKKRTLKSVAVSVAEDAPTKEPHVAAKDANLQKALEESMKSIYDVPQGPLPPVVIREPKSGKYQPLLEVTGKGKAKVTEEQVAHDLLSLQKPKKKRPTDQYIFQRRTSTPTGSSGHDEPSYAELGQSKSEESKKVVPGADEEGQGKGQARPDPGTQAEGQTRSDAGAQEEGQAGSNPDEYSEGQVGPDPINAGADIQSIPSHVVHAGSKRELMNLDVVDVSPQPSTDQLDERFTATAYPKVQENLKLTVEDQVLLEEPASSSGTLSSLQHLKAMMMKGIGKLEHIMANLIQENKGLKKRLDSHGSRLYTLEQLDIPHQVSKAISEVVTEAVDWAMQASLRNRFRDLPEADMKEILQQRMWETESYKSHEDHMQLYKALKKSMNRPFEASRAPGASGSSQVPSPLPPPSSTNQENLEMDKDMGLDEEVQSSDDEDIRKPAWSISSSDVPVPTNYWASAQASNYSPPPENSLLAQTGPSFEIVKVFHPDVIHLQYQMEECYKLLTDSVDDPILRHNVSKPLPLGGPPGQVSIQSDFFFNKDLEYMRYGSKGSRPALSISKMKVVYYPEVGLEQLVPDQFWIEEE
nr:hypothetical protein [Tanacetum cinerariifolium]